VEQRASPFSEGSFGAALREFPIAHKKIMPVTCKMCFHQTRFLLTAFSPGGECFTRGALHGGERIIGYHRAATGARSWRFSGAKMRIPRTECVDDRSVRAITAVR